MAETMAFHEAVEAGRLDEVKRMARAQPDLVNAPKGPVSPVLLALFHGHEDLAGRLVALGATLDLCDAAALGLEDRLEEILARTVGSSGPASPDDAATPSASELPGASAVLSRVGPTGWTPLHLAAFLGRREATEWLLGHGADPAARSTTPEANTPLHAALAGRGDEVVVDLLLKHGAAPGAAGAGGVTPLHLAASRGDEAAIDALLAAGARPVPMEDGRLPSALALERGHPETARRLSQLEDRAPAT